MKVSIYQTEEISDADRAAIATCLGQKTATRDDLKAWLWEHGSKWREPFSDGPPQEEPELTLEDLL